MTIASLLIVMLATDLRIRSLPDGAGPHGDAGPLRQPTPLVTEPPRVLIDGPGIDRHRGQDRQRNR